MSSNVSKQNQELPGNPIRCPAKEGTKSVIRGGRAESLANRAIGTVRFSEQRVLTSKLEV
jgi:hypothetical protein